MSKHTGSHTPLLEALNDSTLSTIFQSSNHAIVIANKELQINFINQSAADLFGYSTDKAIGLPLTKIVTIDNISKLSKKQLTTIRQIKAFHQDGSDFVVDVQISKTNVNKHQYFSLLFRRIDEKKVIQNNDQKAFTKIKIALESMTDAVFISDVNGEIIEYNSAFVAFHKFKNKQECKRLLSDYLSCLEFFTLDGNSLPNDQGFISKALRGEIGTNEECRLLRKDTHESWIASFSYAPIQDERGEIVGSVLVGRDITKQKQVESKLRENDARFRSFFHENQAVMLLIDSQTQTIVDANPAAFSFYGWSKEEFLSKRIHDINTLNDDETKNEMQRALSEQQKYFEARHQLANGEIKDVEIFSGPIQHLGKSLLYSIVHDITSRKQAEEAKGEMEMMYQALVEQASDAFFVHDFDGKFVQVNQQACQSLGYSKRELLSMSVTDVELDFDLAAAQTEWAKIEPGVPFTLYGHQKRKDGSIFPVDVRFGCAIWKEKKLFLGLVRDISARVQAEKELREIQVRFQTAFEYSAVGVCMTGIDGKFNVVNQAFCEILELPKEKIESRHFNDFTHPDDIEIGKEKLESMLANKIKFAAFEKRYLKPDGKPFWVNITTALLRDEHDQPSHFISQIQDISIRKEATDAIKKHRLALQLFIEYAPAAIAMFDTNMVYISASKRFMMDYNLGDREIIGKSHYEIFPELPEHIKETHKHCLAGAIESCEEDPFPRINGELDWIHWEMHPWYENEKDIGGVILFSEVITERKHTEKRIRSQVQRLKSLRSIDMAIINSFDVSTMLNVLLESLKTSLEVDAANILLLEPITNTLEFSVERGFYTKNVADFNLPLGKGLAGQAALNRKTIHIPDLAQVDQQLTRPWLISEEGFQSYFGVPLFVKGNLKVSSQ
ncbi:MAG: PAS domain S-box protein [Anaerolineaceae bacterium]|nr:PAS domain S-box protein [Anaerolineaceae bacterium]